MSKTVKKLLTKDSGAAPAVWRQGDVFIISTDKIPADAVPRRPVLAEGEITGHAHRLVSSEGAAVLGNSAGLFLRVFGDEVTVAHEEHGPVTVPRGNYIVRIQREYHPVEIRRVID
jgi:hypothetical protein